MIAMTAMIKSQPQVSGSVKKMPTDMGLEPTTFRLGGGRSTIEPISLSVQVYIVLQRLSDSEESRVLALHYNIFNSHFMPIFSSLSYEMGNPCKQGGGYEPASRLVDATYIELYKRI